MDAIDRLRLARAYASAWLAVKGWTIEVKPEPHGWFAVRTEPGRGLPRRVRASDLIVGLVHLTDRLVQNNAVKHNQTPMEV